jgi:hypothetical protein
VSAGGSPLRRMMRKPLSDRRDQSLCHLRTCNQAFHTWWPF